MAPARSASLGHPARVLLGCLVLALGTGSSSWSQPAEPQGPRTTPGQFFPPVVEPIDNNTIQLLQVAVGSYMTRAAVKGQRPILVFEFRPGKAEPGRSRFGTSSDLADYFSKDLQGASKTVAYVPEPLTGFAVLAALACDEIVLGPDASLGPIASEAGRIGARERASVEELARRKGRDPDLLLGMLEPSRDLRLVRTADGGAHFVFPENLDALRNQRQVLDEESAWGGRRGVLSAEQARRTIARLLAPDRATIAETYNLPSTALDPTLQSTAKAVMIPIEGRIDPSRESYLLRQIARVRAEGANVLIFPIRSEGGLYAEADKVAGAIARLSDLKTVAYIEDRALGVSALIPLACDEIYVGPEARWGDVTYQVTGGGSVEPLEGRLTDILAERAEQLARDKGHPGAIARAMVDPNTVVELVRDNQNGVVTYATREQVLAEPERFQVLDTVKSADGVALNLTADQAVQFQLAEGVVRDLDELRLSLNLPVGSIREARHTWVDTLVDTLNARWMKGILLFVGFFMLMLELKLPGIGLPAITAALAFLLYFWSSFLGGTADQLEILLFLVGLICLALELFVFPGFGIFGLTGVVLVLVSVVMASHTFIWPTESYEYRQFGWTLVQVTTVIMGVLIGAIVFGRYFPSLPLFNRLVLKPESEEYAVDPTAKPPVDLDSAPLYFLLGEVGRTTTVLRPSGKARFGELLVDVTADGFFIESGSEVEVIEVHGSRVIVKKV